MQFVVSARSKIVYSTKKMAKKGHYSDVYWLSEKSVTLSNPPHAIRPSSKRKNTNKLFDLPDEYSLFHTTFIFIHIKERPTNNTHRWLAMRTCPPSDFTAKYWPIFIYARRLTQPYTLHIGTVEAGQKKRSMNRIIHLRTAAAIKQQFINHRQRIFSFTIVEWTRWKTVHHREADIAAAATARQVRA